MGAIAGLGVPRDIVIVILLAIIIGTSRVDEHIFDMARGSALECAACLDVLVAKKRMDSAEHGTVILVCMVSMLVGLIRSTSASRVHEASSV